MIDTEQEVLWEKNKPLSGYTTNYSYFVNSQNNTTYNKNDLSKVIIKSVEWLAVHLNFSFSHKHLSQ